MPSTNIRAIQLNLGVFLADNNVRRSLANLGFNYSSAAGNVVENYVTVNELGGTFTWTSPMSPSKCLIVSTDQPLQIDITPRAGVGSQSPLSQLLLVDYDVAQIILTNNGTLPARVVIVQI
jgi:hypothetical protein